MDLNPEIHLRLYWMSKNHNHNTFMIFTIYLAPESPPSPSLSTSSSSSLQGVTKKVPFSISGLSTDYGWLLEPTL